MKPSRTSLAWASTLAASVLITSAFGCRGQVSATESRFDLAGPGSAVVSVALTVDDITRVHLSITAVDMETPIAADLALRDGIASGVVGGIPVGIDRLFELTAYVDTDVLCTASTTAEIIEDTRTIVNMVLQCSPDELPVGEAEIAGTFNFPPELGAIIVTPATVEPGASADVTITAIDPEGLPLSYLWTAASGSFGTPTLAASSWDAPGLEGAVTLTVTVNDSEGAAASRGVDIDVAW